MINLYKDYDKEDLYNIYKSNMDINIIKSKELFQINKYINSVKLQDDYNIFKLNTKLSKNKLNYDKEWILRYQIDKFKTFFNSSYFFDIYNSWLGTNLFFTISPAFTPAFRIFIPLLSR